MLPQIQNLLHRPQSKPLVKGLDASPLRSTNELVIAAQKNFAVEERSCSNISNTSRKVSGTPRTFAQFRTFRKLLQNLSKTSQNLPRTSPEPLRNLSGTSPEPLRNLSRLSPEPLQNLAEPVQNLPRTSPEPLRNLSKTSPQPVRNLSRTCSPEPLRNLYRTCPEAVQNIIRKSKTASPCWSCCDTTDCLTGQGSLGLLPSMGVRLSSKEIASRLAPRGENKEYMRHSDISEKMLQRTVSNHTDPFWPRVSHFGLNQLHVPIFTRTRT